MSTLGDAFSRTWHSPKQLWRTYAPVLATPRVPRLLAGVLVGGLGSGLLPVGLVMMVSRHFGSLSRAGLLLAALGIGCAT